MKGRWQKYVPKNKGFAPFSSTHSSTDWNTMWKNTTLAVILAFDSRFWKAVTWSQFLFHIFLLFVTYKFWVKIILQNLQKSKFSQSTKPLKNRLLCINCLKKNLNHKYFELETSGYYCQNGILNLDLQYIGNEVLISPITPTKAPLLFPPLKTHLTPRSF